MQHFFSNFPEQLEADNRDAIESADRDRQRRYAIDAKKPKFAAVTARGYASVPGAIICPDTDTAGLLYDLYNASWADGRMDSSANGKQWRLMHGAPAPTPIPENYGCVVVLPGTSMLLELGTSIPVVNATLPNGKKIRGVTLTAMVVR